MKLLWITTVEINYNGISDCMYQYLQAMDKSGMEIDILAVKPSNPEYESRISTKEAAMLLFLYRKDYAGQNST